VLSNFNVAHGFADVFAAVGASLAVDDLDELTEVWTVEDESEGGFGASLPARVDDWLEAGTLVAAKPNWPAAWSVGVVRRLSTDQAGRRRVGVQLLARGGTAVQLVPLAEAPRPEPSVAGILLPSDTQSSLARSEITIVVPRDAISHCLAYEMRFEGHAYTVMPRRIVEQGPRFCILRLGIRSRAA
jgi:hypothetical protein